MDGNLPAGRKSSSRYTTRGLHEHVYAYLTITRHRHLVKFENGLLMWMRQTVFYDPWSGVSPGGDRDVE